MRRFQFRLERVLRLREHLETVQKMETARQSRATFEAMEHRDGLFQAGLDARAALAPPRGERRQGAELQDRYRHLIRLRREVADAERILLDERRKLDRDRAQLLERSRERRALDGLRLRRFTDWRKETEKEEQAELDESAASADRRRRESGSVLLTVVLGSVFVFSAAFCFVVWRNWTARGDVGFELLRRPFDQVARERVAGELRAFDNEQQIRREKRDAARLEERRPGEEVGVTETGGFKKTLQAIRDRDEKLQRKEAELDSRERSLSQAELDIKSEFKRFSNLQERIGLDLSELRKLEENRKREMSAEKKVKLTELVQAVKEMGAKRAALLLLTVADPDPLRGPAFPVGEAFEGRDLVVEVLNRMPARNRGQVLDAMTRQDPDGTAVIVDMMDNVRTGYERDIALNAAD